EVPHSYWSRGASAAVVGRVALTGGFARPVAESARATGSAAFTGILTVVLQLRRADRVGLIIRLRRRCRRVAGMVRHHRGGLVGARRRNDAGRRRGWLGLSIGLLRALREGFVRSRRLRCGIARGLRAQSGGKCRRGQRGGGKHEGTHDKVSVRMERGRNDPPVALVPLTCRPPRLARTGGVP